MPGKPPLTIIVEVETHPGQRRALLELPGTTTVGEVIQLGINLPEHVLRRHVCKLVASSNGGRSFQVDPGRRLDDLAVRDADGHESMVTLLVSGRASRFGSHWAMACDLATQLEMLSYRRMRDEIVLRDNYGTYVTTRDRLDSGLADPNRYNYGRDLPTSSQHGRSQKKQPTACKDWKDAESQQPSRRDRRVCGGDLSGHAVHP